jgi:hypothetical protein
LKEAKVNIEDATSQIQISSLAYLQFILCGPVIYWKFAKLLSQMKALTNIFRRDKIKCNLGT